MRRLRCIVACAASASTLVAAGCGGGQSQDANEPAGNFPVEITSASFPASQHLSQDVQMKIAVRNAGSKTIPLLAVTIEKTGTGTQAGAFSSSSQQAGLAATSRPNWIVEDGPKGGDTAYANTWAGGSLKPGRTKTFVWKVSPVKAGTYSLTYRIAAGLNGKAKAVRQGGGIPQGQFSVKVDDRPVEATVDDNGNVVRK